MTKRDDISVDETLAPGSAPAQGATLSIASDGQGATISSADARGQTTEPVRIISGSGTKPYRELTSVDQRHYVIGEELARGGMGRISVALDRRLDRKVAIKELLSDAPDARNRFEREARITAKLQHPSIVNIHEAGTWPSGEPFYAMKLVAGRPLEDEIEERASLSDRLALLPAVIAAVDALAYAHSNRVIHRDLKPANILVGEFGETVVIDWGLAKSLDEPPEDATHVPFEVVGQTIAGSVMGTPAYMAPEQAAGADVDERADVYALGAVLYEVLAGIPPFTGTSTDEILAKVRKGQLRRLAEVVRDVPPDLVAIVERAMAHEAAVRYSSARELAHDLKRFQTGQLVGSYRYSSWQLLGRWIRRHRAAVAVGTASIVVLAVGATLSMRRILDEKSIAEQQRAAAVAHRARAEGLVEFMLGDMSEQLTPVGSLPLLDGVAGRAGEYYAQVPSASPDEEMTRSAVEVRIGDVRLAQNDLDGAGLAFQRALATRSWLHSIRPDDAAVIAGIAEAWTKVGAVARARGESAVAARAHRRCVDLLAPIATTLELRDRSLDCREEEAINIAATDGARGAELQAGVAADRTKLLAEAPTTERYRYAEAMSLMRYGNLVRHVDPAKAPPALDEGMKRLRALHQESPGNTRYLRAIGQGLQVIGQGLALRGDMPGFLATARESVAIATLLADRDPTNAIWQDQLVGAYEILAAGLNAADDLKGMHAAYRAGVARAQQVVARDKNNKQLKEHLGRLLSQWAATFEDDETADNRAARAELLAFAADAANTADMPEVIHALATLNRKTGRIPQAIALEQQALDIELRRMAAEPTNVSHRDHAANSYTSLAKLEKLEKQYAPAIAHVRASIELRTKIADEQPELTLNRVARVVDVSLLVDLLDATNASAEAASVGEAALADARALVAKTDDTMVRLSASLLFGAVADVRAKRREYAQARALYTEGLAIIEPLLSAPRDSGPIALGNHEIADDFRAKLRRLP